MSAAAVAFHLTTPSFPTTTTTRPSPLLRHASSFHPHPSRFLSTRRQTLPLLRSGGNGGDVPPGGGGGGGGGGRGGDGDAKRRSEAILALAELGRSVESVPGDLATAIDAGRVPAEVVRRFVELDKSPVFRWLMGFGGFRERLLADDLFLAKVGMECGVGIFTKTAAEWEKRREHFFKELDFVIADVAMAIIADFMLVWLPAPTIALRPPPAFNAGPITKFFMSCPDNAFQVALGGTSYSVVQRIGSIMRNGSKLFLVGTGSSLIGTGITNALIKSRAVFDKDSDKEVEEVPLVATSIAYGVYMAVSSNLRYQILAGVVEQRILEPFLHQHKLLLSASCFAVRTGNTFLGSLMWVDYARLVGIQKMQV